MATIIKLKRGTTTPTTSDLANGEVGIDTSAQKFYINDNGTIKQIIGNEVAAAALGGDVRAYTGDGSTTAFTVSSGSDVENLLVFINGVYQRPTTDYTVSGTTLTFSTAPANADSITIKELVEGLNSIFFADDSSTTTELQAGNTLVLSGGTGIATTLTGDTATFAIDNTVTTNSGTQTLTNKTIDSANNTITITESNISDLGSYITASSTDTLTNKSGNISQWTNDSGYLTSFTETNDLSAAVTWANVPDANITQSSVTQYQAALSITESQISDLGSYITASSTDTLTNKTISGLSNTITGLDATSIADGSISNTEFQYLNGVSSNIQTQLDSKASTAVVSALAIAL